ncbi:class I SAM-dependent methyltransferase [uncultured Algimonas sp.]|uniref:class I SAM-dependent methyltransferase n=1 Tax=uncultured Algimonas sp. TaxID=1547920 RepID=UPI00260AA1C3|nr:class I SAM-dependent methyltransferase [uncultured Algimonas sp.]
MSDTKRPRTIAVIGCGNIGSRLLQSAATVELENLSVFGVEPSEAARNLSAERFAQVGRTDGRVNMLKMVNSADELPETVDLLIIACSAHQRMDALCSTLARTRPRAVMLEKVLFTADSDYDRAAELLEGIPTWVNTTRNIWPDYRSLAARLTNAPLSLEVTGSDWGLGSNGIHFLALAELLADSEIKTIMLNDADARDAKRAGYRELTGTLRAELADDSVATLISRPGNGDPISIRVEQNGKGYDISETGGMINSDPFTILYTSQLGFALQEMVAERTSNLPTLAQSSRLHRLYLDALRPAIHPQAPNGDLCMVT